MERLPGAKSLIYKGFLLFIKRSNFCEYYQTFFLLGVDKARAR